jgi:hypothetical protein
MTDDHSMGVITSGIALNYLWIASPRDARSPY